MVRLVTVLPAPGLSDPDPVRLTGPLPLKVPPLLMKAPPTVVVPLGSVSVPPVWLTDPTVKLVVPPVSVPDAIDRAPVTVSEALSVTTAVAEVNVASIVNAASVVVVVIAQLLVGVPVNRAVSVLVGGPEPLLQVQFARVVNVVELLPFQVQVRATATRPRVSTTRQTASAIDLG